jgi:hypothetical protein
MDSDSGRNQIRSYLEDFTGQRLKAREIKSIDVNPSHHSLPPLHIEVGKVCALLEPDAPPQRVLAIFEASVFLVCTRARGFGRGLPYFFAKEDVSRVETL